MKKLLSIVFALCLVLTISVFAVSAETTNVASLNGVEYETLQAALDVLNDCEVEAGDYTVTLLASCTENVTVEQNEGINIVIDGNNNTLNGKIDIVGNNRYQGTETLTIKNINFVWASEQAIDFIWSNSQSAPVRYAHNITIEGCSFEGPVGGGSTVGIKLRQSYNVTVIDCTANNMHSLIQGYGISGLSISDVEVTASKSGISVGTSTDVTIDNATIESVSEDGYGIRADATAATTMTVTNSNITAACPIILRTATGDYTLNLSGNTLTAGGQYQVVVTSGDDDEAYVETTANVKVNCSDAITLFHTTKAIICESDVYGSITASAFTALEGTLVEVYVNPAYGYKFVKLVVTDANGDPVEVSGTSFVMPASDVTVSAIYEEAYPTPEKINLKATVKADELKAREYKFELSYVVDGKTEVIEVAKNDANGNVNFATIIFNGAGNYTFYIKQIAGDNASVAYDATVYAVNVKVVYTLDGELVATVTGDTAAFTNVAK